MGERRRQEEAYAHEQRRQRQWHSQSQQDENRDHWRRRYSAPPPTAHTGEDRRQALLTLGLPPTVVPPLAELKKTYRTAAMRSHPDRPQNRNRQQEATAEFQRLKAAFDLLASET